MTGIVVTFLTIALRVFVRFRKQGRLHSDDYAIICGVAFYWALSALLHRRPSVPLCLPRLHLREDGVFLGSSHNISSYGDDLLRCDCPAVGSLVGCQVQSIALLPADHQRHEVDDCLVADHELCGHHFVGCIVSELTSCDTISDFAIIGACVSARSQRAQIISLYYSFTADVLTELAGKSWRADQVNQRYPANSTPVLALPLHVILNLQMSKRDKISLACVFGVGLISVAASMIRVFLIWYVSSRPRVAEVR